MPTYKSDLIESKSLYRPALKGPQYVRRYTFSAPVLAAGDVLEIMPLLEGETVHDVKVTAGDLDANGTPTLTLDVGDRDTGDRFIAGSTVGQDGGTVGTDKDQAPADYAEANALTVTAANGPATGQEGDVEVVVYLA